MRNFRKTAAITAAVMLSAGFAGCGDSSSDSGEHGRLLDTTSETTTQMTVEINTETLAPEQQEQVSALAETLTDKELKNKTIKWLSFYDPWHPTGFGNSKPVSVELFEEKYGGEIKYYPTTWANQPSDLATYVLGGEGIDFFPAIEAIPQYVISGLTESYDDYVDWNSPIWQSVQSLNDQYAVGGKHYLMACQATEGYVVYYNKQTIENMGFEDPAELYANGEWTLEKFRQMLLDFVDTDAGRYGLDGWFNCTPLYLASGVPSISLENGKVKSNLMDPSLERAMTFQYDLYNNGLILDKSLFSYNPQINFMGEGKELFYIGGLYEIESNPEIWTKTFGSAEDVFFVPIPRDEQADKYYYNAEIDSCNLCKGAQNPEGVARLMECVIASYNDENAIRISDEKHKNDYGWSDEMVEMKHEVHRLTSENPVRDIYGGLTSDYSALLGDSINKAINGTDWYTTRDSIVDTVNTGLEEINAQIDKLQ